MRLGPQQDHLVHLRLRQCKVGVGVLYIIIIKQTKESLYVRATKDSCKKFSIYCKYTAIEVCLNVEQARGYT